MERFYPNSVPSHQTTFPFHSPIEPIGLVISTWFLSMLDRATKNYGSQTDTKTDKSPKSVCSAPVHTCLKRDYRLIPLVLDSPRFKRRQKRIDWDRDTLATSRAHHCPPTLTHKKIFFCGIKWKQTKATTIAYIPKISCRIHWR